MMRWVILAVLVVALSAAGTVLVQFLPTGSESGRGVAFPVSPRGTGQRPKAVLVGDPVYNFGTMAQHSEGKKTWRFRNAGQGDLILTMVSSTCSCTVANLKDGKMATVKPGGETSVELQWNTKERDGSYRQSATIATNDPEHPTFELVAEGKVYPPVLVYPPDKTVNFMEISTDEPDHRLAIAVCSLDKPDLKITRLTTSRPDLVVAEQEPLPEEECRKLKIEAGRRVTIDVKSGLPLGHFREEVIVGTDHPKQPELRLTVVGQMVGPISVVPDHVRIHDVSSPRGKHTALTLLVRKHRETRIQVARKPEKLKVEIAPGDQSQQPGQYRMTVTIPPGTPPGVIEGDIVLKTDHPQASEVIIPVNIYVSNAG